MSQSQKLNSYRSADCDMRGRGNSRGDCSRASSRFVSPFKSSEACLRVVIMIMMTKSNLVADSFKVATAAARASAASTAHASRIRPSKYLAPLHAETTAAKTVEAAAAFMKAKRSGDEPQNGDSDGVAPAGSERFERFAAFLIQTQEGICRQVETADSLSDSRPGEGATFCTDLWEREAPTKVVISLFLPVCMFVCVSVFLERACSHHLVDGARNAALCCRTFRCMNRYRWTYLLCFEF